MKVELFLASRGFLKHRHGAWGWLIGWLATGSMALGVAALIITLAVMSGFREDIRSKILGVQPHVILTSMGSSLPSPTLGLSEKLKTISAVESWSPYVSGQGLIGASSSSSGAMIKGVDINREPRVTGLDKKLVQGHWSDLGLVNDGKPGIFLGIELARNIGAGPGDSIWIVVPESMQMPSLTIPKAHRFIVQGLIQTGLFDYDSSLAYVDLQSAQDLFELRGQVSGIGIKVDEPDKSLEIASSIQAIFAGEYWVRSWLSLNKNLFSALKLEKTVMFIILTLVTLVAAVMIVSNLLLMISQRFRDIGILRAMGAPASAIRKWFLYQGLIMGLVGNGIGVLCGIAVTLMLSKTNFITLPADVYYIDRLPVRLIFSDIVAVVLASSIIALIASFVPANRAAQLDPLEAIRYG